MSKNFDSPIEVGFCGAIPLPEFDLGKVQRCQINSQCGWMEGALPPHEADYRVDDCGWVLAKDYDQLLGLYRMTCELLRIEQSYADNPPCRK